jgi:hypothetical protein
MDLMTTVSQSRAACLKAGELHRRVRATCEASAKLRRKAGGLRRRVRFAISGGSDNRDIPISEAAIRAQLRGLIERGVLPAVMPRRRFVGQCLETHPCMACGMDIEMGAREYEWTNPANLIVFFHLRCGEIYRALNDGHEGG